MKKNTFNKEQLELLHCENEVLKMKLSLEYGCHFPDTEFEDENPHVFRQFLKNVETFEKAHRDAEMVTVFEFIGEPYYFQPDQLDDDQLRYELKRLMDLLNDNQIIIDTIASVEDRKCYEFIIFDVLPHEIQNLRHPGFILYLVYEEFHRQDEAN